MNRDEMMSKHVLGIPKGYIELHKVLYDCKATDEYKLKNPDAPNDTVIFKSSILIVRPDNISGILEASDGEYSNIGCYIYTSTDCLSIAENVTEVMQKIREICDER